jgi:uncharacterized protein (TIGR00369 family)
MTQEKAPNALFIQFMEHQVAFNQFLGIRITKLDTGFARMELPYRDEFLGDPFRPALHGGVISTLVDTCGGAAVWTTVQSTDRVATVDLRVDYLRPGPQADLACEATVVRAGNRVGVADMKLFATGDPERVIATGKGVYNIVRREG